MLRHHLLIACASLSCGLLLAEEGDGKDIVPPSPWSHEAKVGLFLRNNTNHNQEDSRDPTIAGSTESINYLVTFDGKLTWEENPHSVEQLITLRYGREKQGDEAWFENTDQIDYDGAYKYAIEAPHLLYGAWGADSVLTGPEPDEEPLDTFLAKISAGYGQRHNWNEQKGLFEGRVGARAQKRWGRGLGDQGREIETGLELFLRAEDQPKDYWNWFAQYEAFSEFEDLGHVSHLLEVGVEILLTSAITANFRARAYYESEPNDAEDDVRGYDELSWRQESLIGITYSF